MCVNFPGEKALLRFNVIGVTRGGWVSIFQKKATLEWPLTHLSPIGLEFDHFICVLLRVVILLSPEECERSVAVERRVIAL